MTQRMMATSILVLLALTARASGEDKSQDNAEYDHLKALQSLVGTWRMEGKNEENGHYWEYRGTAAWSPSKNMLVYEGEVRAAEKKDALADQKWAPWDRRYFVWNNKSQNIEEHFLHLGDGTATVLTVIPRSNGEIRVKTKSATNEAESFEGVLTVRSNQILIVTTNRRDAGGKRLPDKKLTLTRAK